MAAGALVIYGFDPSEEVFFPVCPLYRTTAIACPGCGTTRALHALLNGDVLSALDFNLLSPLVAFAAGYLFLSLTLHAVRGRGLAFKMFTPALLWTVFAVTAVFTVARNLPMAPFVWLYP